MCADITVSAVFDVPAKALYDAWLSSEAHSAFTGSTAEIDSVVGGRYSAWDGYIEGETLELEPYRRILQSWRTSEFPEGSPDSLLEVQFEEEGAGTRITLVHSDLPESQAENYRQGWVENYFDPMRKYFSD
jgi:activator of HSP90 ATPase